jgi:hypothetical protein
MGRAMRLTLGQKQSSQWKLPSYPTSLVLGGGFDAQEANGEACLR